MKKPSCGSSLMVAALLISQSLFMCSCGGGGSVSQFVSAKEASAAVAGAKTSSQMHSAVGKVLQATGIVPLTSGAQVIGQVTPNMQSGFEEYQLNAPSSGYPTLAQIYGIMNGDSLLAGNNLSLSAADVVASINSNLSAAYANPNNSAAASLILLSCPPGQIPASAPTLTVNTPMSPIQQLMLSKYLGELVNGNGSYVFTPSSSEADCISNCNAVFYAEIAAIGALTAACAFGSGFILTVVCGALGAVDAALASDARDKCKADCHNQ